AAIKNRIMKITERFDLHMKDIYSGEFDTLHEKIVSNKKFDVIKLNDGSFKIMSKNSVGTPVLGDTLVSPIFIIAQLESIEPEKQMVTFSAKMRRDHYFIALVFFIALFGGIFSQ